MASLKSYLTDVLPAPEVSRAHLVLGELDPEHLLVAHRLVVDLKLALDNKKRSMLEFCLKTV